MAKRRPIEFHLLDVGNGDILPPFEDFIKLTERLTGRKETAEEFAEARREYDEWVREVSGQVGKQPEGAATSDERPETTRLLAAIEFASRKHSTQRRKDRNK